MSMTVRELLADRSLRLELLVVGDLDRPVRWVHTIELPDPAPYLSGGEVVLSAGVWMRGGHSARQYVASLQRARIAALGFGLLEERPTVPAALLDACRSDDLTLFSVIPEVPFMAVTQAFVERFVAEREAPLTAAIGRNEQFVQAVAHGGGLDAILRVLGRHRKGRSWIVGRDRRLLARYGAPPSAEAIDDAWSDAFALQPDYPVGVGGWSAYPIVAVGSADAALVVEGEPASLAVPERAAIEQALSFLGLELARQRAIHQNERRFAAELLDLIAAGPPQLEAASARLEAFGLDPNRPLLGLACEPPKPGDEHVDAIERVLRRIGLASVVALRGGHVRAVVQSGEVDDPLELARTVSAGVGPAFAVGVGSVAVELEGLRASLIEADHASRFARLRRHEAGFASYAEVGSHALLLALHDDAVLQTFRDALLRPVEQHDARRHTELVRTVDAFLRSSGHWQATADALHIHVSTLRYRLARVEELTGRDLSSMEDRVDLYIALESRREGGA